MAKVSVLIPVYNGEKTIYRTIDSVRQQTYRDIEIVICDDGSIDNTRKIIEGINDQRINYYYKENGGIASARNFLISKATGEYVLFIDADDTMEPFTVEKLLAVAKRDNSDVVVCDYRFVYKDGKFTDKRSISYTKTNLKANPNLLVDIMPQFWNKLMKKSLFDIEEKFPDGLVFEDLCLFTIMAFNFKSISKLDEVCINYFQFDDSIMGQTRSIKKTIYDFDKIVQIICQYYADKKIGYENELEGLLALNSREIIDAIFKNKCADKNEKILVVKDVLQTINYKYPKWYKNKYYLNKYQDNSFIFKLKRYLIDYNLAHGKIEFVINKLLKG